MYKGIYNYKSNVLSMSDVCYAYIMLVFVYSSFSVIAFYLVWLTFLRERERERVSDVSVGSAETVKNLF